MLDPVNTSNVRVKLGMTIFGGNNKIKQDERSISKSWTFLVRVKVAFFVYYIIDPNYYKTIFNLTEAKKSFN